jgi:hypothetical protein
MGTLHRRADDPTQQTFGASDARVTTDMGGRAATSVHNEPAHIGVF